MDLGFDPFAMSVALIALGYAVRESRMNNSVVLRIRECHYRAVESVHENRGQMFHEFSLLLRNQGVSLHRPSVSLSFAGRDGRGRLSMPLKRSNSEGGTGDEFAKGMIAVFGFKSYELDEHESRFLSLLEDPAKQDALLCVYSQGYLAGEFRVAGIRDRIASQWNRLAFRFNRLFARQMGKNSDGVPLVRHPQVLPRVRNLESQVMGFIRALKRATTKPPTTA